MVGTGGRSASTASLRGFASWIPIVAIAAGLGLRPITGATGDRAYTLTPEP